MERKTIVTLGSINRRFYADHSSAFDRSRQHAWPGWKFILEKDWGDDISVLDVGCGNGRFLRALTASELKVREYVGIDTSISLLDKTTIVAKELNLRRLALYPIDLSLDKLELLPAGSFDLIVLFGLLHHIPSKDRRLRLLIALQKLLAPHGRFAFSIWNFASRSRFSKNMVSWGDLSRYGFPEIEIDDLDEGDFLLKWGINGLRYCHQATVNEIILWKKSLEAELVAHYSADGKEGDLNEYLIFERKE
ncbi:class I SAM-dependent methyltransferase [Myxococcota bacterium]|nr:class I SAM-dependent methyltransferase [Myxococcota bacterium]